jgi:hypothetical protein
MVVLFVAIMLVHETPNWLLENRRFEEAVKSLEFYKTDPKLLVYDDSKRKSVTGSELSYTDLVEMYRTESENEHTAFYAQQKCSDNTFK